MKASYLGAMGYAHRRDFPPTWPTPPSYSDPATSVQSYQDGIEECEFAEEMGFRVGQFLRAPLLGPHRHRHPRRHGRRGCRAVQVG